MTQAHSLDAPAIPEPVGLAPPLPTGLRGAIVSTWRWLAHNVRVALLATPDSERALAAPPAALRTLIRDSRVALVTTRDGDGRLHTQPLEAIKRDFDGEIWLVTTESAPVIAHVRTRADVQLTYVDPESSNRCIVLDGIARVSDGEVLRTSAWRTRMAEWGITPPRSVARAFIRVDIMSADVWE